MLNKRTHILTAILAGVCVLMVVAACGDDDDGGSSGDGSPTVSGSPNATSPGRTPAPTAAEGSDDVTQLSAAYLAGVDGKITYRYVGINFGQHPDGTWIVYRLGDSDRQDWISAPEGIEGTTTIIRTSGDDYFCSSSEFFGSCQISDEETFAGIDLIFSPVRDAPLALIAGIEGATISELPEETYAGVTAKCFQIEIPTRIGEGPTGTESVTLCYADDGRMLYQKRIIDFEDDSFPTAELTLEAQEIGEPAESDFEPPHPVSN